MRPDVETATQHVIATCARLAGASPGRQLLAQEIEDALCEGYAQALAGEAWLIRSERDLHAMLDDAMIVERAHDLQSLAREQGHYRRSVNALRRELVTLRREHDRLRASSPVRSRSR